MEEVTPGSQRIVEVLLDDSVPRPVWIQAWGRTNTIARALKTIEDSHPERMAAVAQKIRFYPIWEQNNTYQSYIRPRWGRSNIPTIISDQFIALFYHWKKYLPADKQALAAALEAAEALVRGQNKHGGWDHTINFADLSNETVSFDDNQTQSAVSFLMSLNREIKNERLAAATRRALEMMIKTHV